MSMAWNGIERNKLDYILSDILPLELSELFSFYYFYDFLSEKNNRKKLEELCADINKIRYEADKTLFKGGWATKPLKFRIMKGLKNSREMSLMQPLSALNLYLFIQCYQNDILSLFSSNIGFGIRKYSKNSNLYYKSKLGRRLSYFNVQVQRVGREAIQQVGNYFNVLPYKSINEFTDSNIWRMANFRFPYYAKMDYKSCFDSIYTHTYTWIIERNSVDAIKAKNSNLFVSIDRVLQNINGRYSNGILVGPEFSRMIAEILLQEIDEDIKLSLLKKGYSFQEDYLVFRYVDDIFVFAKTSEIIDIIRDEYEKVSDRYRLRMNDLKFIKDRTPWVAKGWLEKTRELSDKISNLFYQGTWQNFQEHLSSGESLILDKFIFIDRLKDEISSLLKDYPAENKTIVSFLLSSFLNNISKKSLGYKLFSEKALKRGLLILEIVFYIYAYYPSFEQTRKVLSIISFFNSELDFKGDEDSREKLQKIIRRYSFIFNDKTLSDLCDWFPFFVEYNCTLDVNDEIRIKSILEEEKNPILMGNFLLYSKYDELLFSSTLKVFECIVREKIEQITSSDILEQEEFWFVLIFHNCPFISRDLRGLISSIIISLKGKNSNSNSRKCIELICDFLELKDDSGEKNSCSFFCWRVSKNFTKVITYRTYQRTLFKKYKNNLNFLYSSIN